MKILIKNKSPFSEKAAAHPGKNLLPGMRELMDEDVNRRLTLLGVGRDYYAVGVASPVLPTGM